MFPCFNFSSYTRLFVKFWVEKNVNVSNELSFFLYKLHWVASNVYNNPLGLHSLCSLYFDKHQENEMHSLNGHQFDCIIACLLFVYGYARRSRTRTIFKGINMYREMKKFLYSRIPTMEIVSRSSVCRISALQKLYFLWTTVA